MAAAPNLSSARSASLPDIKGEGRPPSSRPLLMPATVAAGRAAATDCEVCEKPIRIMAFRFTGVCSGNCEKRRDRTVVLP